MNSLVMDGVRRPENFAMALGQSRIQAPKNSAPSPLVGAPKLQTQPMFDGIYRPAPIVPALPAAPAVISNAPGMANATNAQRWLALAVTIPMLAVSATSLTRYALSHRPTIASHASSTAAQAKTTTIAAASPTQTPVPTPAPVIAPLAGLSQQINSFAAAQAAPMSVVVTNMATGETISHNPNAVMTSASLYKLFVATEVYHRVDTGALHYNQAAGGGTGRNIADCLRVMINVSDNACGSALGDLVGWKNVTAAAKTEGFANTDLVANPMHTTATDVSALMRRLYEGTLLSPDSTAQFLGLLKDQRVNNRLPVGLPAGTTIAHKTGDLFGFVHDTGIVYSPKATYLVTIMSGPWSSSGTAPGQFAALSSQIYKYFNP